MTLQNSFSKKLSKWHERNKRDLPWKRTKDPYKIWLSEIILQQTRVEQGSPYYEKLIRQFPTVKHLAEAKEDEVMKAWQGLGYYTRARNAHAAAKQIMTDFEGKLPSSHDEILKLRGVGDYTAAAIASFAFDLPHAVVDGNVFRVLSRMFGIRTAIDSSEGKRVFIKLANDLLDRKNPGEYNQALMNFGAMVCTPANPGCDQCFLQKSCFAFNHQQISEFPVKSKKNSVRTRWFNFLVFEDGKKVIIEKRKEKDIWKSLFQFPLIETETFADPKQILNIISTKKLAEKKDIKIAGVSAVIEHKLSHQTIMAQFIRIFLPHKKLKMKNGWKAINMGELKKIGFPKLIVNYFEKLLL